MSTEYLDLFRNFKELDIEDKRRELLKVISDEIRSVSYTHLTLPTIA